MKQIYFLSTLFCLTFVSLNAQTITLENACEGVNGDYEYSGEVNGRPSFSAGDWTFRWTGARWQHNRIDDPKKIGMYNESFTDAPPPSSFSTWVSLLCEPGGTVSGDGTSTTLSTNDFQLSDRSIKIYPNPASNFIKISGLTKEVSYSIYNILGSGISKGKISNNEKLDIQQLSQGLYLLKFENGNTIKLIKE